MIVSFHHVEYQKLWIFENPLSIIIHLKWIFFVKIKKVASDGNNKIEFNIKYVNYNDFMHYQITSIENAISST